MFLIVSQSGKYTTRLKVEGAIILGFVFGHFFSLECPITTYWALALD